MRCLDEAILFTLATWRSPWLNKAMMDVSSLGSPTIIILISGAAFSVLWIVQDRLGAARVVTAVAGAEIWLEIIKRMVERPRPTIVPYLVDFTGFSFPSGHALVATATYGTLAAVACTHVEQRQARIAFRVICWTVVAMVAISRMYLGIHYPTDVVGGVLIGLGWRYFTAYAWRR